MLSFEEFLSKNGTPEFKGILMAIDPGETTGIRVFNGIRPIAWYQVICIDTASVSSALEQIEGLLIEHKPEIVVMEEYRVYAHRTRQHAGSDLFTARLIGALEAMLAKHHVNWVKQTATQAKKFFTDVKLRAWGYYIPGKKHANDATRHGCYYLLFGHKKAT